MISQLLILNGTVRLPRRSEIDPRKWLIDRIFGRTPAKKARNGNINTFVKWKSVKQCLGQTRTNLKKFPSLTDAFKVHFWHFERRGDAKPI
ncbi:hypothetical protein niasHT_016692 [Heterodera trifolii]|uniref:Transposase n=1 Tax=Heterodera trifolii TaxID=157864 RepID=A0ABD2KVD5_9BILA